VATVILEEHESKWDGFASHLYASVVEW
jgi:hypothetical protein